MTHTSVTKAIKYRIQFVRLIAEWKLIWFGFILFLFAIVPICMPSDVADFTGRMATVTGWGRLKYGGGVPSVLQEVQVIILT